MKQKIVTFLKGRFHGDTCDLNRFDRTLSRSIASNKNGRKDAEEDGKDFRVRVHVISLRSTQAAYASRS